MWRFVPVIVTVWLFAACVVAPIPPAPSSVPATSIPVAAINLDPEIQALIASSQRAVFLIPFSHWDSDWHETIAVNSVRADQNILDAMQLALQYPRFRYTLENARAVRHFWEAHPEQRATLLALVRSRQFSFATTQNDQQDTSLAAPAVQIHNFLLGQDWIERTFGVHPRTAWQADAFGNSASLPILLNSLDIPYVFMGRGRGFCQRNPCPNRLPHAFHWASPADPGQQVLATLVPYQDANWAIRLPTDQPGRLAGLRRIVEREFDLTTSSYLFLPLGDDFWSPQPYLPALVDAWNAADSTTALVMADPETAFDYLATQQLPQLTSDLNPIWQAFYASRPLAKIADKESEALLTAADKLGMLIDAPEPAAWDPATLNADHGNITGVGFDSIWLASQRPRLEQTVASAAQALAGIVASIAGGVDAPLVIFNSSSWPRSEVIELRGHIPDMGMLPPPVQRLGPDHIAIWAQMVPPVGYLSIPSGAATGAVPHPTGVLSSTTGVTLSNGLVRLTIDPAHGGTLRSLALANGPELIAGRGDDVVYLDDGGDVYGARFGKERARSSMVPAHLSVLADGPLIARVQATFELGGQPVTKTVTLYANSARVDISVDLATLPETTALMQMPATITTTIRTDDTGFAALGHPIDSRPIISGTITYRREVFYPITGWSDISDGGAGLSLITHGLQGLGGTQTLSLMLVRAVSDLGERQPEGLTDPGYHLLRYAYLPHSGRAIDAQPWLAADAFNHPLFAVWRDGDLLEMRLPFVDDERLRQVPLPATDRALARSVSLIAAENGLIIDVVRRGDHIEAVVLNQDPRRPAYLTYGSHQTTLGATSLTLQPVRLK